MALPAILGGIIGTASKAAVSPAGKAAIATAAATYVGSELAERTNIFGGTKRKRYRWSLAKGINKLMRARVRRLIAMEQVKVLRAMGK